jgi:hypothetical protein
MVHISSGFVMISVEGTGILTGGKITGECRRGEIEDFATKHF